MDRRQRKTRESIFTAFISLLSKKDFEHITVSEIIEKADKIILPGVGAFGDAAEKLFSSGLADVVKEQVEKGKPLLGICLGMQLLFDKSYEYGEHKGLGLIKGEIRPIKEVIPQNLMDKDTKIYTFDTFFRLFF